MKTLTNKSSAKKNNDLYSFKHNFLDVKLIFKKYKLRNKVKSTGTCLKFFTKIILTD